LQKFAAGMVTGDVLAWSPKAGWQPAVTHPLSGANGVEVSPDGRWLYVSEWSARRLWKFSLDGMSAPQSIVVDFLPDNLRWTEHGTLLLTGQNAIPANVFGCEARHVTCAMGFTVIEIDPNDLTSHLLLRGGDQHFGGGTGAIFVGRSLWVGSFRGDQIARYIEITKKDGR